MLITYANISELLNSWTFATATRHGSTIMTTNSTWNSEGG